MTKRATLRDIAKIADVSAVTVHKVIYGKRGVADETRKRILALAREMDYSVNEAASSLKRKAVHIAVILQNIDNPANQNFFFRKMWEGVARAESDLRDFGVRITRMECGNDWQSQEEILRNIARCRDIDGTILHCGDEMKLNPAIDHLFDRGIPVVTVNSDAIGSKRVGCVSADNGRLGMLGAELMGHFMAADAKAAKILLVGGSRMINLKESRDGFKAYMKLARPDSSVVEIFNTGDKEAFRQTLAEALTTGDGIAGIHSVTSRDTYNACRITRELGLSGKIQLIGSDAFTELAEFFDDGTLHATIWKDEQAQAERAVRLLHQYIVDRPMHVEPIRIGVVLKNNLTDYL